MTKRHYRTIGLLGGSFNPAHEGHLHISREALRRLNLDEVWWLVSPQNPLKSESGMASLDERMTSAEITAEPERRVHVSDVESVLGTRYTVDTLKALVKRYPHFRFVWLMGSDNMVQLPRWKGWTQIFNLVPIAVFTRHAYDLRALSGKAAQRFGQYRVTGSASRRLALRKAPAWTYLGFRRHKASATAIRAGLMPAHNRMEKQAITPQTQPQTGQNNNAALLDPAALANLVTSSLEDDKALEITTIDLTGKSTLADYMVIASGTSARQISAIADHLLERLKAADIKKVTVDGQGQGDWVLIDAGDIIVHLFRPEVREFYNLEKLWSSSMSAPSTGLAASEIED